MVFLEQFAESIEVWKNCVHQEHGNHDNKRIFLAMYILSSNLYETHLASI